MKATSFSAGLSYLIGIAFVVVMAGMGEARGLGIKAGAGRLHPAIDLDFVYDSNVSYSSSGSAADMIMKIRPGITLSFPSEMVDFEMSGRVGYDYYFGVDNSVSSDLSSVAGEADLHLGINPKGQFSFFFEDIFSRTSDPRYNSLSGKFDRTDNEAKARLQFKPGGGALMFDLAYGLFVDWFDSDFANADALFRHSCNSDSATES